MQAKERNGKREKEKHLFASMFNETRSIGISMGFFSVEFYEIDKYLNLIPLSN